MCAKNIRTLIFARCECCFYSGVTGDLSVAQVVVYNCLFQCVKRLKNVCVQAHTCACLPVRAMKAEVNH